MKRMKRRKWIPSCDATTHMMMMMILVEQSICCCLSLTQSAHSHYFSFSFVAGVIARERVSMFERMLWRVCRGNVYMKASEIETPIADPIYPEDATHKTAFIIFFQGEQLKIRVRKICEGFVLYFV